MSCEVLQDYLNDGWILVDVREPHEFGYAKIKGAINVRLSEIDSLNVNNKYLLYCRSGSRSEMAVKHLRSKGFTVLNAGGIGSYSKCTD
jgi:phage shock protein E